MGLRDEDSQGRLSGSGGWDIQDLPLYSTGQSVFILKSLTTTDRTTEAQNLLTEKGSSINFNHLISRYCFVGDKKSPEPPDPKSAAHRRKRSLSVGDDPSSPDVSKTNHFKIPKGFLETSNASKWRRNGSKHIFAPPPKYF